MNTFIRTAISQILNSVVRSRSYINLLLLLVAAIFSVINSSAVVAFWSCTSLDTISTRILLHPVPVRVLCVVSFISILLLVSSHWLGLERGSTHVAKITLKPSRKGNSPLRTTPIHVFCLVVLSSEFIISRTQILHRRNPTSICTRAFDPYNPVQ